MTASSTPVPQRGNSRRLVIVASIAGAFIVLCIVLNVLGANSDKFLPGPTQTPTVDAAAAVQHLATVFTNWYGGTPGINAPVPTYEGIGVRVDAGPFAITLAGVETAPQYDEVTAQTGNTFVAATLTLDGLTEPALNIRPDEFTLQDAEGRWYSPTPAKSPRLESLVWLPAGESMDVVVSFEVPEGAHGFVLTFTAADLDPPISVPLALGF